MVTQIYADTTPLLEAIAASEVDRIIAETLLLLGQQRVPPAKIAGRVGLAALWGGGTGQTTNVLAVAGQVAQWIRSIPLGPEPDADERRFLSPALPLVQGFLAVAEQVQAGLPEPALTLPDALLPAQVQEAGGPLGGVRAALERGDIEQIRRILLGYHATGADYRELLTTLYAALATRYPAGGRPMIDLLAADQILGMAEWGGHMQAFVFWYPPLMVAGGPDMPTALTAQAFAAVPEHNLTWLRTRLAIPQEGAAGVQFQRSLMGGDATTACEAVLAALRAGATPMGVAAGMALAAAEHLATIASGDRADLLRAGEIFLYVHAVHVATRETQDPNIWPLLYTAAAAVNAMGAIGAPATTGATTGGAASLVSGGLIAPAMLRALEQQLGTGDAEGALATARRYVQMGHSTRALAGIVGGIAAMHDAREGGEGSLLVLPLVAGLAEEYLMLPPALQQGGVNALLTASIRVAAALRGPHAQADRVRAAINDQLRSAGAPGA